MPQVKVVPIHSKYKKPFGRTDKTPKELEKSKKNRHAHIREVVTAPTSRIDRLREIKAIEHSIEKNFNWTPDKDKAALLLAEDRLTNGDISKKVGVTPATITMWLRKPAFIERVEMYATQWRLAVMTRGVCIKENRLRTLDAVKRGLEEIIARRAEKYSDRTTPGVNTGLMVRKVKAVGHGKTAKVVRQWELDSDLLDKILAVDQQAAKETGQWKDITENRNEIFIREYDGINPDDV